MGGMGVWKKEVTLEGEAIKEVGNFRGREELWREREFWREGGVLEGNR